jgi:membrane-associated phospholipid phosphatase
MHDKKFSLTIRSRLLSTAIASLLLFAFTYVAFVYSQGGQHWENAAMRQSWHIADTTTSVLADKYLRYVTSAFLLLGLFLILIIGLARKRYALTIAAIGTVLASFLGTEILKYFILDRPNLVDTDNPRLLSNTFPSGHTTIAMSFAVGLIIIVPYRFRPIIAFLTYAATATVGSFTVIASWHRPSDTFGANFLVLGCACLTITILAKGGRVRIVSRPSSLGYLSVLLLLGSMATACVGYASFLLAKFFVSADASYGEVSFHVGASLSAGVSALTMMLLLTLLYNVDLEAPSTRHLFHKVSHFGRQAAEITEITEIPLPRGERLVLDENLR